jgi:hypothetical protein
VDVTNGIEICGRCLVHLNASGYVAAKWGTGNIEQAPNPQNPRALRKWAEDMLYGNNARFEINGMTDCMEAISTWNGDPVCSVHLWQLASAEMQGVKYR